MAADRHRGCAPPRFAAKRYWKGFKRCGLIALLRIWNRAEVGSEGCG